MDGRRARYVVSSPLFMSVDHLMTAASRICATERPDSSPHGRPKRSALGHRAAEPDAKRHVDLVAGAGFSCATASRASSSGRDLRELFLGSSGFGVRSGFPWPGSFINLVPTLQE